MTVGESDSEVLAEAALRPVSGPVRQALEAALEGRTLSVDDATHLLTARGPDLRALTLAADHVRRQQVGDAVTYVVNRNINFTNVCVMSCKFCAFSRTRRSEEGYFLDTEEVVRRALEAQELGATEVCIQAGLPPDPAPNLYIDVIKAVKAAAPELHIHALSPEEVRYGAGLRGIGIRDFLSEAIEAGLGSLPGTSAEILDDGIRRRLAGGRITTAEWIDVVTTAHRLGLSTTATMMYGHIEGPRDVAGHLDLVRQVQADTGGFSEFVPLSFVHAEAPMHVKKMLPGLRPGPTGNGVVRVIAVSRLVLGASVRNIQTSWVKEGLRMSQRLLDAGANDLGGTLINESISTSAGATHGQFVSPSTLREAIRDAGRPPVERDSRYHALRRFAADGVDDFVQPLDTVTDPQARFGSYRGLIDSARLRRSTTSPG